MSPNTSLYTKKDRDDLRTTDPLLESNKSQLLPYISGTSQGTDVRSVVAGIDSPYTAGGSAIKSGEYIGQGQGIELREGRATSFTLPYVQMRTREVVQILLQEFESWSKVETSEALAHISAIKDAIEKYIPYLSQKDEHRIFIGTLLLIVNQWRNLNSDQLTSIHTELQKYTDGQISAADNRAINAFMVKSDINPFFGTDE